MKRFLFTLLLTLVFIANAIAAPLMCQHSYALPGNMHEVTEQSVFHTASDHHAEHSSEHVKQNMHDCSGEGAKAGPHCSHCAGSFSGVLLSTTMNLAVIKTVDTHNFPNLHIPHITPRRLLRPPRIS